MTNPLEEAHAYAELGGLLKERFGLLYTVDQCRALVRGLKAARTPAPIDPAELEELVRFLEDSESDIELVRKGPTPPPTVWS